MRRPPRPLAPHPTGGRGCLPGALRTAKHRLMYAHTYSPLPRLLTFPPSGPPKRPPAARPQPLPAPANTHRPLCLQDFMVRSPIACRIYSDFTFLMSRPRPRNRPQTPPKRVIWAIAHVSTASTARITPCPAQAASGAARAPLTRPATRQEAALACGAPSQSPSAALCSRQEPLRRTSAPDSGPRPAPCAGQAGPFAPFRRRPSPAHPPTGRALSAENGRARCRRRCLA